MEKKAEFKRRLTLIAERLKTEPEDLIDWYKDDVEDIVQMEGKAIMAIVKEYLGLREHYRK